MDLEKEINTKFVKGQSGNPNGRPKTDKLTEKDRKELEAIFQESIDEGNTLKKSIIFMVRRATLVSDVFKIMKEFAPYITAKLSSVKSETKRIERIEIVINGKVIERDLKVLNDIKHIEGDTDD